MEIAALVLFVIGIILLMLGEIARPTGGVVIAVASVFGVLSGLSAGSVIIVLGSMTLLLAAIAFVIHNFRDMRHDFRDNADTMA